MDDIRRQRTELENHLIDELISGRLTRREFVRRGTVIGMSIPLLGAIVAACGGANDTGGSSAASGASSGSAAVKPGGTVRAAVIVPTGAINPVTVGDQGGLCMLGQVGEFLCVANPTTFELEPVLADSWTANSDSSEWTFKLKSGVTFHDGSPMTADDVVYTMDLLSDPKGTSNALSVVPRRARTRAARRLWTTRRSSSRSRRPTATSRTSSRETTTTPSSSRRAPTRRTSRRRSRAPARSSSTSTRPRWAPRSSATTTTGAPRPTRTASSSPSTSRRGRADPRPPGQPGRRRRPDLRLRRPGDPRRPELRRSSTSAVDRAPPAVTCETTRSRSTTSACARRSRCRSTGQAIVERLFEGKANVGNDSPFARVYPSTDPSVPQRAQDIDQGEAAALGRRPLEPVGRAGHGQDVRGPGVRRSLIQNAAKADRVHHRQLPAGASAYYGDSAFGRSPWLDSTMGITDYGHRGVPNVFLGAPLLSDGTWNSAHFKNPDLRQMVKQYIAASDLQTQQRSPADPGAAARRDADDLRLLLQLPRRHAPGTSAASSIAPMGHVWLEASRPAPPDGLTPGRWLLPAAGEPLAHDAHGSSSAASDSALVTLWLLAILVFFLVAAAAGRRRRGRSSGRSPRRRRSTPSTSELGTNEPAHRQYTDWI